MQSISGWTDIEYPYRLSRASYICECVCACVCVEFLAKHFSDLSHCRFIGWAILEELSIRRRLRTSVGDRKRVWNTVMLIYRHDMSFGLRYYESMWTSFWVFLPQSNNFRDGFRLPGSTRKIVFIEIQHEIILASMCLCQCKMWRSNVVKNIFISHVACRS